MRRHCELVIVDALGDCSTDGTDNSAGHGGRALDVSSRRSGSRVRKSTPPAAVAVSSVATTAVRPHHSEVSTVRAVMDLGLPRFDASGDRSVRPHRPWIVMTDS